MSRYAGSLAPSSLLAPSSTLAPNNIPAQGGPIGPHQIAMGVGTGGALVDVSSYVEFGDGVSYTYGRTDQFSDVQPGRFTFTLNNADGRFTPDNPASPLATRVTEGMPVAWLLGTRLAHFTVLAVEIPADEATWHQIVVTCDDMLGTAGRHGLTTLPDDLAAHGNLQLMWKLDEEAGSWAAVEAGGDPLGPFTLTRSDKTSSNTVVTFGAPQAVGLPGTALTLSAAPGQTNWYGTDFGNTYVVSKVTYPAATDPTKTYVYGFWGMWVYPGSTINLAVTPFFTISPGFSDSMQIVCTPTTVAVKGGTGSPYTYTYTPAEQAVPHYVAMSSQAVWQSSGSYWALFVYLYVDGVYKGNAAFQSAAHGFVIPAATASSMSPVVVNVSVTNPAGAAGNLSGTVQRISHTLNGSSLEENALFNTLDGRRAVLDYIADDISSATYSPAGALWSTVIGFPDLSSTSILDVYNMIARTEQGHLFCTTTGSLTAPVEQIQVRARDRPTTPKASFDVTTEGDGLPSFVRDITNVAAQVEVDGPVGTVVVTDPTVTGRYITAGLAETVLSTDPVDLRTWGQDRLNRGKNIGLRVQTFTVDAMTTPTDRSRDLLALVPGDRIRLANTPVMRLGFTSWDGWLIGATETHSVDGHRFALTLAPTTATTAVYDTDLFASGGDVTLAAAVTSSATTVPVASTSGAAMSTVVPYTIQVDAEQMTVTAVTGGNLTVTRGAAGTTAAGHASGVPLEVVPTAYFAF